MPVLYVVSSMISREAARHMDSLTTELQTVLLTQPSCSVRFTVAPGFGVVGLSWKASGSSFRATRPAVSPPGCLLVAGGVGDAKERAKIARMAKAEGKAESIFKSARSGEWRGAVQMRAQEASVFRS